MFVTSLVIASNISNAMGLLCNVIKLISLINVKLSKEWYHIKNNVLGIIIFADILRDGSYRKKNNIDQ